MCRALGRMLREKRGQSKGSHTKAREWKDFPGAGSTATSAGPSDGDSSDLGQATEAGNGNTESLPANQEDARNEWKSELPNKRYWSPYWGHSWWSASWSHRE